MSGDRSTRNTPSGNRSTWSAAACSANLVFPVPPGPVSVTSRVDGSSSSARTSAICARRPRNDVICVGRLFTTRSRVARRGKRSGRPGATSWKICSVEPRSFRRCSPRSRSSTPSGNRAATTACTAWDTRTCPPCPAAMIRAARCTSTPMYPSSCRCGSPVCKPIRAFSGTPPGHSCASSPRCACRAAATASLAEVNTTKKLSPSVPISTPPCAANDSRRILRCADNASPHAAPNRFSSDVDPSISLNSSVSVPVGRAGTRQLYR